MLNIRRAEANDAALILNFIRALAEYEHLSPSVVATEQDLLRDGFGREPKFRCVIAEWNQAPVGFALYFYNYSTFQGRPGIFLEDLFVNPEFRGKGIGRALLAHLAHLALERGCGRFQWAVLDWNRPARDFYEALGTDEGGLLLAIADVMGKGVPAAMFAAIFRSQPARLRNCGLRSRDHRRK